MVQVLSHLLLMNMYAKKKIAEMHVLFTLAEHCVCIPFIGIFVSSQYLLHYVFSVGTYGCCSPSFISCCFKFVLLQFSSNDLTDMSVSMIIWILQSQWSSVVSLSSLWASASLVGTVLYFPVDRERILYAVLSQDDLWYLISCLYASARSLPALTLINYIVELIVWGVSLQKCVSNDLSSGRTKEMKY